MVKLPWSSPRGPELVVLGVGLPVDRPRRAGRAGTSNRRRVGGVCEANQQVGRRASGLLRVVQDEPARDVGAIAPARIIDARDPVVRPARGSLRGVPIASCQSACGVAAGVDVEEERTDDLGPVLAFADRDGGPAVVAASPVVEDAGGGNLASCRDGRGTRPWSARR